MSTATPLHDEQPWSPLSELSLVVGLLAHLHGLKRGEVHAFAGLNMSRATYYRRLLDPGEFRSGEITKLASSFGVPESVLTGGMREALAWLAERGGPTDDSSGQRWWAPWDSNPQPADYLCEVLHLFPLEPAA